MFRQLIAAQNQRDDADQITIETLNFVVNAVNGKRVPVKSPTAIGRPQHGGCGD